MANEQAPLTIKGFIEFVLKKQGIAATQEELDKLAASAKSAGVQVKQAGKSSEVAAQSLGRALGPTKLMNSSLEQLRGLLLSTFGVGALAALGASAVAQFMRIDKAIAQMHGSMDRLGFTSREAKSEVHDFLARLEGLTGFARTETIPVFEHLLRVTKDYRAALELSSTAADLAKAGLGTLQESSEVLARLWKGDLAGAAEMLDIQVKNANGSMRASGVIAGEIVAALDKVRQARQRAADIPDEVLDPRTGAVNPEATRRVVLAKRAALEEERKAEEEFQKIRARALDQAHEQDAKRDADARKKLNERLDAFVEKTENSTKQAAERRSAVEEAAEERLWQQKIRMQEEGTDKRLGLELQHLAEQEERAIAAAKKVGADTLAIEETYALLRDETEQRYWDAREEKARKFHAEEMRRLEERARAEEASGDELLQAQIAGEDDPRERARLEQEADDERLRRRIADARSAKEFNDLILAHEQRRRSRQRKLAQEEIELERAQAAERIAIQQTWAQAAFTIGNALFAENKALAIAEAIVNTYLGVTMALKTLPPPASYAAAALTLAQGLAAVMQIRKSRKEGSGTFDDPVNDAIAMAGGRQSANDFVRLASAGFQEGLSRTLGQAQAVAPAPEAPGGDRFEQHIHIGNVYGGDQGLQDLSRRLERAARHDLARRER